MSTQACASGANPPATDPFLCSERVDLDAYLHRLGLDRSLANEPPSLESLRTIQLAHACTIPFENLDVVLGRPIKLDLPSVANKLINQRRGGYCFEQNNLIIRVLEQLGYQVDALSGRVRAAVPREITPARTHLFARVTIDSVPWIVDVGVGGFTPSEPIRMDTTEPQETRHDTRRVIQDDHVHGLPRWFHQVLIDDHWLDIYDFTGEHMPPIDRHVGNWWTSTSPHSKFRQAVMAARAEPDGSRHTLSTKQYAHRKDGQVIEKIEFDSTAMLLEVLADRFGLELPADTTFGIDGM